MKLPSFFRRSADAGDAFRDALPVQMQPMAAPAKPKVNVNVDGWENAFTGYGTERDKIKHTHYRLSAAIPWQLLSDMYYTDDVAAKLIDKRPDEAFRRGYDVTGADADAWKKKAKILCLKDKVKCAWKWARCYGTSLIVPGLDAPGLADTPLNDVTKIRDVKFLNVIDSRRFRVAAYYLNPFEPKYGEPMLYEVLPYEGFVGTGFMIHETRVIRFDGTEVDYYKRQQLGGMAYSVLQRPYDVIQQFATVFASAAVMTADASQGVFKMKGLFDMIASNEKEQFQARMKLVDMSRSALRSILLDSDGEDYTRVATSFAGLPDMIDRFMIRLAASVDMPVTILMGRSPAGENATGDSDFQHWYDSIASDQENYLNPRCDRLDQMLLGKEEPDLERTWLSLSEPTDLEEADTRLKNAQADIALAGGPLFYSQQVALARADVYGVEIDEKQLKASLEAEQELELNPPPPPPVGPGASNPAGGATDPNAPKPVVGAPSAETY